MSTSSIRPAGPSGRQGPRAAGRGMRRRLPARVLGFAAMMAAAFACDRSAAMWAIAAPSPLVAAARFVTAFGQSLYMFALSGAVAAFGLQRWSHDRAARARLGGVGIGAACFFSCIAASGLLAQALKHLVGRVRPAGSILGTGPFTLHPLSSQDAFASFPSGHTTSAFAAATALFLLVGRGRAPLLACACAIGASRVLVGRHYPSDVVAGACLGALTSCWVVSRFAPWLPDSGRTTPSAQRGVPRSGSRPDDGGSPTSRQP